MLYERTGHVVRIERSDAGVLRAYRLGTPKPRSPFAEPEPIMKMPLVGLVVIRDGRVTYAEHDGVVFPFHKTRTPSQYRSEIEDWRATVRESAS